MSKFTERDIEELKRQNEYLSYQLAVAKGEDSKAQLMKQDIRALGLSTRSKNALYGNGISTIANLIATSRSELIRSPNLGSKSLDGIIERLAANGLALLESRWPKPTKGSTALTFDAWWSDTQSCNCGKLVARKAWEASEAKGYTG